MTSGTEMLSAKPIRGEKPLGMSGGLEAVHAPLALPRLVVRILGAVVHVLVLPMFSPRQDVPLCRAALST
jgi:hypothetical protein